MTHTVAGFVTKKNIAKCLGDNTGTMISMISSTRECYLVMFMVEAHSPLTQGLQPHACANVAQVVFPGELSVTPECTLRRSVGFCNMHHIHAEGSKLGLKFINRLTTPLETAGF